MSKNRQHEAAQASNAFQFTLAGLIVFSLALIGGASYATYQLTYQPRINPADNFTVVDPNDKSSAIHVGAWGALATRDLSLERPAEFLTDEVASPQPETWFFKGMNLAGVQTLLAQNGIATEHIKAALEPQNVTEKATGVELRPPDDFLFTLSQSARQQLYGALAGHGVNPYLDSPLVFPGGTINAIYADSRLNPEDLAVLKRLVYANGTGHQLADYTALLGKIPTVQRRVAMAQALSRQSAVMARLIVNGKTDINKIADYWGHIPNVRFTDIRPLFDSLKALPEGGSVSLIYLLPPFARNRLYTFPLPPQPGEPVMDSHWTTFNFYNETPDNRFNDPNYTIKYITDNYYPIAAPSVYGDILVLMNDRNEIKQSAVFLADDLVFTKNGNNYRQPWMIMHVPDLLAAYPASPAIRAVYLRRKSD